MWVSKRVRTLSKTKTSCVIEIKRPGNLSRSALIFICRLYCSRQLSPRRPRPFKRKLPLFSKSNFTDTKSNIPKFWLILLSRIPYQISWGKSNIVKIKWASLTEKSIPSKAKSTRYNLLWFNPSLKRLYRRFQRLCNVQKKSKAVSGRTKYRNTLKIYKKKFNEAYYDYFINNLIETPSSDQPKKFWRFVDSKRQDSKTLICR